jgi:hypothetical protein
MLKQCYKTFHCETLRIILVALNTVNVSKKPASQVFKDFISVKQMIIILVKVRSEQQKLRRRNFGRIEKKYFIF